MTDNLIRLFKRDLIALKTEISAYRNEKNLWLVQPDISNSAGNLCLHIVGNLSTFIGAVLGGTNYVRQRDLEFSLKNIPRTELIRQVDEIMLIVEQTLQNLEVEDLQKEYKIKINKEAMTTEYFLMHLSMHLAYHLGQINYHRRLLDY